ncbi:MAG: hypothetical protein P8M80_03275, partial [Pirellulaceae bacterium]|nr:hypothetical protein [Pirellulaceae bacterium]
LIRLTHIFAATDSSVPKDFRYITRNNESRSVVSGVLIDPDGILEEALDQETVEKEILNDIYSQTEASSCTSRTWNDWALSSKSGLSTVPPFETEKKEFQTQEGLEAFLAERGCEKPTEYHYKSRSFYFIRDTFLPSEIIQHLDQVIDHEPLAWANYLNLFFKGDPQSWNRHFKTTVYELAANRHNQRKAKCEPVNASWICELSQKPCLLDTFNRPRIPAELLLRSPETEPLMGIECFVQAEIDTPDNRDLLEALGARTTPTGPDKLLDRIKALSAMESPPIQEIVKWYEAINKVVARSEPEDIRNLANRFKETPLIYTQDCGWAKIDEVFRFMDEDGLPDTPVVHSAISDLRMWPRLGLADKPTIDLVLKWLHTLPTDSALDAGTKRRVKSCLQNYPETVWTECGHWLSLDGHWANINSLSFKLLRNHKIQTGDLFAGIHRTTADLRNLNDTDCQLSQFSELRDLATCLQMQLAQSTPSSRPQPEITWLATLGQLISRVHVPDDPDGAKTFQAQGKRLSNSRWNAMKMLQVTPYLDGEPAGQPHQAKVFWHQENIYVVEGSFVANYQKLVNEIARPFASQKISDAIRACIQRDTQFISEYFASHFELMEPEETRQPTEDFQLTPENPSSSFSTTESESRGTTNPKFAEKPLTFNTQGNRNKEHVSEDIVGREHLHASSEYDFSHNLDSADDFPSISENGIPLETDRHVQEPPATETEYPQEAHGSHEPEIEKGAFETFLHESDPISLLNENDASLNQFLESDLSDESSVTTFNRDETANSIDPEQAIENPEKQKPQRTARASIIEQWAEQEAFVWLIPNQNARTENGRKLQRASGLFHWEICSTDGQIESRLWVTSQSLIEGVELPAEIWNV